MERGCLDNANVHHRRENTITECVTRFLPSKSLHQSFRTDTTYGGWLLVVLTAAFWYWSGAATLGMAYLLVLVPLVTMTIAFFSYRTRRASRVQAAIFWRATVYIPFSVSRRRSARDATAGHSRRVLQRSLVRTSARWELAALALI